MDGAVTQTQFNTFGEYLPASYLVQKCKDSKSAWNGGAHANPTFAGDTIYAYSEILDKADLPGRTDCGALRVRLVGLKDVSATEAGFPLKVSKDGRNVYHDNVVLDLDYWLLVPRRPR